MNEVIVITAPVADERKTLDAGLVSLTKRISEKYDNLVAHGVFGGQFSYGAEFENDVFMMHPECWCMSEDCDWCSGNVPNFYHKPSGLKVWWYKWIGRGMEVSNPAAADLSQVFSECMESIK